MNTRPLLLLSTIFLTAGIARAQDEQSATSSADPAARYWTAPRVQQDPPRKESAKRSGVMRVGTSAAPLVIENDLLEVKALPECSRLQITHKPSHKVFATDGSFNAPAGLAKIIGVSDKNFGPGKAIEISYPNGDRDTV